MKSTQLKASFLGMANLPLTRQLALLAGFAASIALGIYIASWFRALGSFSPGRDIGWQLLGGFVAILVLLVVLRPVLRRLADSAAINDAGTVEGEVKQDQVTAVDDEADPDSSGKDDELNLELVKAMADQEPKRVAQVVKLWLAES